MDSIVTNDSNSSIVRYSKLKSPKSKLYKEIYKHTGNLKVKIFSKSSFAYYKEMVDSYKH